MKIEYTERCKDYIKNKNNEKNSRCDKVSERKPIKDITECKNAMNKASGVPGGWKK